MRIVFMGTGTSHGIPVIGCQCEVCTSRDPRDTRTRTSVLVEGAQARVLIDAPPELRLQLLKAGVGDVDAMLITHAHADHIGGLDDVRVFSERSQHAFPLYGPAPALRELRKRFDYVFRSTQKGGGKPVLSLHPVTKRFRVKDLAITPVPVWHGRLRVFGYRMGGFAYLTDTSALPPEAYARLRNLEVLVLPALRWEPHETHFHVAQALQVAEHLKPRRVFFTHMCHRLGHAATEAQLPPHVRLAYDGLEINL